jgi:hypothetical protein
LEKKDYNSHFQVRFPRIQIARIRRQILTRALDGELPLRLNHAAIKPTQTAANRGRSKRQTSVKADVKPGQVKNLKDKNHHFTA